MDAKKCDRCLTFYTESEISTSWEIIQSVTLNKKIDLCSQCTAELNNFLINKCLPSTNGSAADL